MKNNEKVVLAAVQNPGGQGFFRGIDHPLQYASADMKNNEKSDKQAVRVTCEDLGGATIATISVKSTSSYKCLRNQIAQKLDVPPPALKIILPGGELLGKPQQSLLELLGLA